MKRRPWFALDINGRVSAIDYTGDDYEAADEAADEEGINTMWLIHPDTASQWIDVFQSAFFECTEITDAMVDTLNNAALPVANLVTQVTVIDPDTDGEVEVAIYKEAKTGGMIGVDSSYVLSIADDDPVHSPIDGSKIALSEEYGCVLWKERQG